MRCWQPQKGEQRTLLCILRARVYMFVCVVYAYVGMYVHLPVDRVPACKLKESDLVYDP